MNQAEFKISVMCRVLRVSRSGYYAWRVRPRSARAIEDEQLMAAIKELFFFHKRRYGMPRIRQALRDRGIYTSRRRVARLLSQQGLKAICHGQSTDSKQKSKEKEQVAPDQVHRCFTATRPNELWVADSAFVSKVYVPTAEGFLYLAMILDVFSRRIVGWSMSVMQDAKLMVDALQMAVQNRRPKNVIHHSDHGSQYTSHEFQQACVAANVSLSMGSVGDCYDNAMAESFFATLETELIDEQPRARFRTRTEARREVFRYVEGYYNRSRTHSALDYQTPLEFERKYAEEHGSSCDS